ncbi:muramidase [Sphingomonas sp. LB2R24]|uniref:muramidase n=1 Tax=Sphingomonas sorbitolis TaxID=3096165 RepID=UPI002FC70791
MIPIGLTAKAIQLRATGLGIGMTPLLSPYAIAVHAGAVLRREPVTEADAEATVRNLITLGADFVAGPLAISGRDFATYGVTPASVFDACALAHIGDGVAGTPASGASTVSNVTALIQRAFGARITNTIRPMNANYGARYSWHKFGQAVDFVPAGGVNSINRDQIRALMGQSGIRLIELLGPGDRGHSNHWHIAFARPGQGIDRTRPIEEDEDWIVNVTSADAPVSAPVGTDVRTAPASFLQTAAKAPPQWDVFATAEWRAAQGGSS